MSTTIDTLIIDIQSTSTGAIAGIESLALSLEKLKKSTISSVAVRNLRDLTGALKELTPVSSNAKKLGDMAAALGKLSAVGSLRGVVKQIRELPAAMRGLSAVTVDAGLGTKLSGLVTALAPLSQVKATGFNSTVNSLARINKVTESLDDGTIARFTDRVKRLSDALTPLSTKMTAVQSGLRGINTNAKYAGAGVQQFGAKVSVTAFNLSNFISVAWGAIAVLRPLIRLFSNTISQAIEWDGISARFGRGFGAEAQETYDWIQRLNEEMGINVQQFMQYSSVYATMLSGFGVAHKDATEMALGYAELTYDIWAGYNDIYKNFADAADAVKSAIAGEVEPIRRAGFTIVEATLKETAANHGLAISLEKATEAEKSYLRYLTLVDQAHAQNLVGTYANELNTAEGLMRTFSQQLKTLAQAFGSLFLPALVQIMPYLSAFIELLTEAVHWLAALMGFKIQPVDWSGYGAGASAVSEVGDAVIGTTAAMDEATRAAKDLKNATLGIDELNVISPPTTSGGGGGGADGGGSGFAGLDVESLWDESIFAQVQRNVDEIKEKLKDMLPVIGAIAGALATLGMVTLLTHLGEALAQMALLQKVLATVAVVALEAVLTFKFADNYLEDGKLLDLIGEAVTTAIGSYLLYKTWGAAGLAIGFGVSLVMQLAAITFNLADGGVSMDDPELWIQTAFTTAVGAVGGGLIFWKAFGAVGAGKGVIVGALAALSLSLAAITIGNAADGDLGLSEAVTSILSTALGGATGAALVTFLGLASGGTGFLIGASVMLAINVIGVTVAAITEKAKQSAEEDLDERFGEIELSVSEIRFVVDRLIPEWTEGALQAVDLRAQVESLAGQIESEIETLEKYEWKVSVGLGLTPDEDSQYQKTIESFISSTQAWISERGYALEVGLRATGASDFTVDASNLISGAASAELERIGKELQSTINDAYEDGLLDIDELEAIQNIRNDMLEVVNALNSSEIEAELSMLEMKWTGVNLTPESFQTMMSEWNTTINETVKPALESTVKENLKTLEGNVAFAKMQLLKNPGDDELNQLLADAEAALQEYMDSNPLENLSMEATVEAVTFGLNTLQDAFAAEIKRAESEGWFNISEKVTIALENPLIASAKVDFGAGDVYTDLAGMFGEIRALYNRETAALGPEVRENMETLIEAMKPTMADYESIAEASRIAGTTVPAEIRSGLNDYQELAALAGDAAAINYMLGQQFSTDSVFLNTLATAEGAGAQIDKNMAKGLLNNLDYVVDEATGLVVGIRDAVTGETIQITPILEENLSEMGVNIGNALGGEYQYVYDETTGLLQGVVDSATGNSLWVNNELKKVGQEGGAAISDGVLAGADAGMKEDKKSWLDWAIWPWNWFKEKNEINSPSKLFERGGKHLTDGLRNGMSLNSLRDKLRDIWEKAKEWWSGKPALEKAQVAVSLVKKGWSSVKNWIGNIPAVSQAVSLAKSKWSTIKKWIGNIPSVSQAVRLAKSGWSSVRNWIGSVPTISAGIKLVKSGWSTIKKWLGNLTFDLGFKLPKIGVRWGERTVLGFKISYPSGFYTYAQGGFPDVGEMFIAREAGPEMVGKIGSRTTVANNEQIVEGISEGVYAAVLAAMRASEGNGGQAFNIYLDGRQLTAAVEQRQRERGASLMGRQVYSY